MSALKTCAMNFKGATNSYCKFLTLGLEIKL